MQRRFDDSDVAIGSGQGKITASLDGWSRQHNIRSRERFGKTNFQTAVAARGAQVHGLVCADHYSGGGGAVDAGRDSERTGRAGSDGRQCFQPAARTVPGGGMAGQARVDTAAAIAVAGGSAVGTGMSCPLRFEPPSQKTDPVLREPWPGGFIDTCDNSRFDLAGRVFQRQYASRNLVVPAWRLNADTGQMLIGAD